MVTAVFPGSFDPVTLGHMDVISRASHLFDAISVIIMHNVHKSCVISPEDRMRMLQKACASYRNVRVDLWDGLLSDYIRRHPGTVIIRGARNSSEYEQEAIAAQANRLLYNQAETLIIPCREEKACISSSAVREIASFGGDIRRFVPDFLAEEIAELLSK